MLLPPILLRILCRIYNMQDPYFCDVYDDRTSSSNTSNGKLSSKVVLLRIANVRNSKPSIIFEGLVNITDAIFFSPPRYSLYITYIHRTHENVCLYHIELLAYFSSGAKRIKTGENHVKDIPYINFGLPEFSITEKPSTNTELVSSWVSRRGETHILCFLKCCLCLTLWA